MTELNLIVLHLKDIIGGSYVDVASSMTITLVVVVEERWMGVVVVVVVDQSGAQTPFRSREFGQHDLLGAHSEA